MNAPSRRSADTEGTGRITPDAPASPAPPQGEREAFEHYWRWSRERKECEKLLFQHAEDDSYVNNSVQRHWWTWQQARASLRASPSVPVAQDEREPCKTESECEWAPWCKTKCHRAAALSAATPPAAVPMSQKTQDGHSTRAVAEASTAPLPEDIRRDALRYRWLRRCRGQEHDPLFTVVHELDGLLWGGDLDAALDAAMGTPPADNKENGNA